VPVAVEGLRELSAALAKADREVKLGWRRGLRQVAEPIRLEAESLARSEITRIGPRWYKMRTGVTRKLVYVAPRQRGVRWNKKNPGYRFNMRRPNLADLLMNRAMEPALHHHEHQIENAVEHLLDEMADDFNHGGPI